MVTPQLGQITVSQIASYKLNTDESNNHHVNPHVFLVFPSPKGLEGQLPGGHMVQCHTQAPKVHGGIETANRSSVRQQGLSVGCWLLS